ncbi:hypothetical protein BGX31_003666 [Mortierella sp. GBA43]|nr:hypothetical protein BGX31_003666 [Mortierella sp. GBA43]
MARLLTHPRLPRTAEPTVPDRSKALPYLKPKAAKQSGRVSLETKLQHLQDWLKFEQIYRELTGNEPVKRTYEKTRRWPEKYIARLLAAKDKLELMPTQTLSKRFNVGTRPFYPVEILLVKMINDIRDKHITIDQRFLQLMAHEIYTLLLSQIGTLLFDRPSFSVGWVYNFRRYWKIDYQQLKGEAGSVNMEKIAGRVEEIKNIITNYRLEDVYNADETGLFLQTLYIQVDIG